MELNELIAKNVDWNPNYYDVDAKNHSMEFTIRAFNIADESYIETELGGAEGLENAMKAFDVSVFCKLAFNQMTLGSKKKLMSIKFMDMDSSGKEVEKYKLGHEKVGLFINSMKDFSDLVKILLETRGLSMPLADKIGEAINELSSAGEKKK